jgi:hypothetical protein
LWKNWDPFFGSLSQQSLGVEANDIDIWQNFIVDFQGSENALGQDYGGMYNFDVPKWYPTQIENAQTSAP